MNAFEDVRRFRSVKLLAVGDLMLDHMLYGAATRISPEAHVPVVEIERESYVPGGMGNACINTSMLGATVLPVGIVGDDLGANGSRTLISGLSLDYLEKSCRHG